MAEGTCIIGGCDSPVCARGWCSSHYQRYRKHGDPLAGNPTPRVKRALDNPDGTRTCLDCGAVKPLDEFPKDKNATRGHRANCRPCHSARATAWYQANKADFLPRVRERYVRDAEKIRARDAARYQRDKQKRLLLAVEASGRRRARLRHDGPWDAGLTRNAVRKRDGDRCCYCETVMSFVYGDRAFNPLKATLEHVQPICRGGFHVWANAALACAQCNARKQKKTLAEWIETGGPVSAALLYRLGDAAA